MKFVDLFSAMRSRAINSLDSIYSFQTMDSIVCSPTGSCDLADGPGQLARAEAVFILRGSNNRIVKMTEKLTYMDVMMYVLPGAVIIVDALAGAALVAPSAIDKLALFSEGGLFASVVFVLMSFVAGNALQIFAHLVPERLIRIAFWSGNWASQLALLEGGPVLSDATRRSVKSALGALGIADAMSVKALEARVTRRHGWWSVNGDARNAKLALEVAQTCFGRSRALLADAGAGLKVATAESYYQFFRGLFTSMLLGSAGFGILALSTDWKMSIGLPSGAVLGAGPLALAHLVAACLFGWRARGAGEGFVREVYLALSVLEASKKLVSASPSSPPPAL